MKYNKLFIFMALALMPVLPSSAQDAATGTRNAEPSLQEASVPSDAPALKGGHLVRCGTPFLEQLQKRDSILIADQLLYGVDLSGVEAGTQYAPPQLGDSLQRIVFLRPWQLDTLKVHKAKKGRPLSYDLRLSTVLTAFDEGEYQLSELPVGRLTPDGVVDTLLFDAVRFEVKTMPVDTTSFQPHDLKDVIRYPLTAAEVLPWVGLFYLVVLSVIAAVCLVKMRRRKLSEGPQSKDPAHIVALRKLDTFRGDKLWAPEKQKQFYSGVTDVLREYIAARYDVGAMEMTTKEIFREMKPKFADEPSDRKALLGDLENLFETADYVKFAKHTASEPENAAVLPLAVRFVTQTYQDDLAAASDAQESAATDEAAQEQEKAQPEADKKDDNDRFAPVPDDKKKEDE